MKIIKHDHEKIDDLHKRLIQLQTMGVQITYANGHRWLTIIDSYELDDDFISLHSVMKSACVSCNEKVYGSLFDALNLIDYILEKCGKKSLLELYNDSCNEEWAMETHSYCEYDDEKTFSDRVDIHTREEFLNIELNNLNYKLRQLENEEIRNKNIKELKIEIEKIVKELEAPN